MTTDKAQDAVEGSAAEEASRRLAELVSPEGIDRILADAKTSGTPLDGPDGILNQMSKAVIERALGAEMNDHLGYPKHDAAGRGTGNSRNGYSAKTVTTNTGKVQIQVPRGPHGRVRAADREKASTAARPDRRHDPVAVRERYDQAKSSQVGAPFFVINTTSRHISVKARG